MDVFRPNDRVEQGPGRERCVWSRGEPARDERRERAARSVNLQVPATSRTNVLEAHPPSASVGDDVDRPWPLQVSTLDDGDRGPERQDLLGRGPRVVDGLHRHAGQELCFGDVRGCDGRAAKDSFDHAPLSRGIEQRALAMGRRHDRVDDDGHRPAIGEDARHGEHNFWRPKGPRLHRADVLVSQDAARHLRHQGARNRGHSAEAAGRLHRQHGGHRARERPGTRNGARIGQNSGAPAWIEPANGQTTRQGPPVSVRDIVVRGFHDGAIVGLIVGLVASLGPAIPTMKTVTPETGRASQIKVALLWEVPKGRRGEGMSPIAIVDLTGGQSFAFGAHGVPAKPDGLDAPDAPIRVKETGWVLDVRGITGGSLHLRGRDEDPMILAKSTTEIPIRVGDHGIVRFGALAVFFQYGTRDTSPPRRLLRDVHLLQAALVSVLLHAAVVVLLRATSAGSFALPPIATTTLDRLPARYGLASLPAANAAPAPAVGDPKTDPPTATIDPFGFRTNSALWELQKRLVVPTRALSGYDPQLLMRPPASANRTAKSALDYSNTLPGGWLTAKANAARAQAGSDLVLGQPQIRGSLTSAQVRRVLEGAVGNLRTCVDDDGSRPTKTKGSLTFEWKIQPAGGVTGASVANTTIGNPKVEACLLRTLKGLSFPRAKAGSQVTAFVVRLP